MNRASILRIVLWSVVLIGRVSMAQSTVVVREVKFAGELGIPESELQEYVEFLKGHRLEESRVLKQGIHATRGALGHRGFLRAEVAASLAPGSGVALDKGVVLNMKVNAGRQYQVRGITFSGRTAEFPAPELRDAIHLQAGDVADANEIDVGCGALNELLKKAGKRYSAIPSLSFDDTKDTVSIDFSIEE